MATETLTLADFTLNAPSSVTKTFTGKSHVWDSWVASCTGGGDFDSDLTVFGVAYDGPFESRDFQETGTGDPASLDFYFEVNGHDGQTADIWNFQIVGTYTPTTTNNHAKKSALAMSGH